MSEKGFSAWLEVAGGHKVPLGRACSIGRSRSNELVLDDSRVSRQHAIIQPQGGGRHLIVDFGSANGTRVNGRRVVLPVELRDGAEVEIAGVRFLFRQAERPEPADLDRTTAALTERETRHFACWLLVVDIVDSTLMFRTLPPEELPQVVGRWFVGCRGLVESSGGLITQYTGDGFFAHWLDTPASVKGVWGALQGLMQRQRGGAPAFRWVLHLGQATAGTALRPGEESLMGPEVHLVFRLESLAKVLNRALLLSEPAARRLGGLAALREAGSYELKGFEGRFKVYEF